MSGALVADGVTKRYRRTLALDHCSFAIPEGAIVALVGPNGAGKSTLLHCATGLTRPSAGTIRVLGGEPGDRTLPGVGFVAQDAPLYRDFTAGELLTMGDKLNRDFDVAFGRERLPKVGVPLDRRVDRLSGGQRAQMALCLALAKRPRLLLLDEPLASLDPLARREFLSAMVDAVAETPTTVVLSSHLITDLERVCDHLLVLHAGRVQVFAETDQLLATHKILIGPGGPRRARIAGVERGRPRHRRATTEHAAGPNERTSHRTRLGATRRQPRRPRPRLPGGQRRDTARPPGGERMTWLVWRQHRKQLLFGVLALVVLGAFFVGTGRPIHDRFEKLGLPECLPAAMDEPVVVDTDALDRGVVEDAPAIDEATLAIGRCVQTARDFYGDYQNVLLVGTLLWVLPMLAGMFWGAPLVAREIEHGTHRLAWTQGVSRLRWAATKIGLVSVAVLVMTAIYAGMLNWWITPVMQTSGQRFAYIFFDSHGIVVFGYALFALALGVFAGAVTGRMLPAMATTLVGFLGTRLLVMLAARTRFLPTETRALGDLGGGAAVVQMRNDLNGDWIVATNTGGEDIPAGTAEVLTIHPAGDFWAFQAIETAIFVALAVGLVLATIYWIRRRIA